MSCRTNADKCIGQMKNDSGVPTAVAAQIVPGAEPVEILRYESASGYHRKVVVRAVEFNELESDTQRWLINSDPAMLGSGVVYQSTHYAESSDGSWDKSWDHPRYGATSIEAVEESTPWHHVERYEDVIQGEPHPLFEQAQTIRHARQASEKAAQQSAAAQENAERQAAMEKRQAFIGSVEKARSEITASPLAFNISAGDAGKTEVNGRVILLKGRKASGLAVHKQTNGQWVITHLNTGLAISKVGYGSMDEAAGTAALLAKMVDWTGVHKGADIPAEIQPKVSELVHQSEFMLGSMNKHSKS